MSTAAALLLTVLAFLVGYFSRRGSMLKTEIEALRTCLGQLGEQVSQLKHAVAELEDRIDDLPLSERARDERRYDSAATITVADVRRWKQGDTMLLLSKSYHYPDEEPFFDQFEYKHDHLDETKPTNVGYEIHGFRRRSPLGESSPWTFLAREKECTTWDCAGAIKRRS